MSEILRSSSIPSLSTRSAFSRRQFVTLQLTDVPLPGSSSIPLPSIELPSIELPSVEPSSKISTSVRFPFPESSLATSSSLGPRLLEPAGPDYQVSNGSNPEIYHIDVKTFLTTSPCIAYNLPALRYDTSDILAVIGKVRGLGDFDSDACHRCAKTWEMCTTPSTLKIFSEGTEGVLGTHVTLILKSKESTGLCAVIGRTQDFLLGELSPSDHALIVSSYVSIMINRLSDFTGCLEDLENDVQCNMVSIICPRGCNSEESKRSRYACACRVCHGLFEGSFHGLEGDLPKVRAKIDMGFWRTWSERAYCVSSIEREDCGLLMIATNNRTDGNFRAISTVMTHPIDLEPIQDAWKKIKDDGGNLIQVFATVNPNIRGAGDVQFSNFPMNK